MTSLTSALRRMLPGAGVGRADPSGDHPAFAGEEIGPAVERRLREFRAGRAAARLALAALGLPPAAIPARPDRSPGFPPGLAGSIAHCGGVALAAVLPGARGLGIDVEPARGIEPALWGTILRPDETAVDALAVLRVFVAKEAAYKAQHALSRRLIDFHALRVEASGDGFTARFTLDVPPFAEGQVLAGRWAEAEGYVVAAVVIG